MKPRPSRPYPSQFNHAVLRLTAAAPTSPPSTAPELFPIHRPSPPRICFPFTDRRPPQHSQQFGHGFVQACTLQNIIFPGKKKKIAATCGGDHTSNRKKVLLFPYSCKSYVSACTIFIPQKTLVDRFFFILDVPSNSRCTRFLLIYYFTLARGPSSPLNFNS